MNSSYGNVMKFYTQNSDFVIPNKFHKQLEKEVFSDIGEIYLFLLVLFTHEANMGKYYAKTDNDDNIFLRQSELRFCDVKDLDSPCVPLAIKTIMISFKVSQLDLIALKRNNVKISNNTIMIVLIAKGTQGRSHVVAWAITHRACSLEIKVVTSILP